MTDRTAAPAPRELEEFLKSGDSLWICRDERILFRSAADGIIPLLTYLEEFAPCPEGTTACDRIVGNAAALLLEKAACRKVYSAAGSEPAVETLDRAGIGHVFLKVIPYVPDRTGAAMCPFEKASLGKSPEEFYDFVRASVPGKGGG